MQTLYIVYSEDLFDFNNLIIANFKFLQVINRYKPF